MLKRLALFISAFALVALGFAAGTTFISSYAQHTNVSASQTTTAGSLPVSFPETNDSQVPSLQVETLSQIEQTIAAVYNRASLSVVAISTDQGSGSGFVIDTQGHIATNYHVVSDAKEIVVNFLDGTITRAEVVGLDADSDVAVIKVDLPTERLIPLSFGSSDALVVGQTVLAIGSPFGERWTLTSGIVSALDRTIQGLNPVQSFSIGEVIQTDAAINPGNSGGPLLNLQGQVVGINSQIRTESGANTGIGFAIPSELVQKVAQELITNGSVDYSLIGIQGGAMSLDVIEALNLANNQRGAVVSAVVKNGPADEAGLQARDIITAINGIALTNGMDGLIGYLAKYTKPGDVVTLTILRNGQTFDLPITLGSRHEMLGQ